MGVVITRCKKSDLKELSKIYFETYTKALPNEGWSLETATNFIYYQYKKQPDCFFVAKTENRIVGATFGYIKPFSVGNCFMLEEVFVNPEYQSKGIGKKLLNHLFNHLKQYKLKIKQAMATTYENESKQPLKWYLHSGFKKCDLTIIEADLDKIKIEN